MGLVCTSCKHLSVSKQAYLDNISAVDNLLWISDCRSLYVACQYSKTVFHGSMLFFKNNSCSMTVSEGK